MKRTQIQLDEITHELLRKRAFEEDKSVAALIRDAVDAYLQIKQPSKPFSLEELTFVGSGRAESSEIEPVSERHDDALAEDFAR